jgi:hypothetical protein
MDRARVLAAIVLFVAAFIALVGVFLVLDDRIPVVANAAFAVLGIMTLVASFALRHSPTLYFWQLRLSARFGRTVAPSWHLRATYRARFGPDSDVDERIRRRLAGATVRGESTRRIRVEVGGSSAIIAWEQPDAESRDDWIVAVDLAYPSVAYHDSVRFLRELVMPLLEEIEGAIGASDRGYEMTVEYQAGRNPFEGLLVRSAPGAAVTSYYVVFKPEADRDAVIELSRSQMRFRSSSRSAFESIVERLLTLRGKWPTELFGRPT